MRTLRPLVCAFAAAASFSHAAYIISAFCQLKSSPRSTISCDERYASARARSSPRSRSANLETAPSGSGASPSKL